MSLIQRLLRGPDRLAPYIALVVVLSIIAVQAMTLLAAYVVRDPVVHAYSPRWVVQEVINAVTRVEAGTKPTPLESARASDAANMLRFEWRERTPDTAVATPNDRLERFVAEQVLPKLRRVAPESAVVTRPRVRVPPLTEEKDGAAEALVKFLTGANETIGMAFATEAGQFQEAGLSAIVCGPGSIAQAHQPDEFIEISQMEAGQVFLRKLVAWAQET